MAGVTFTSEQKLPMSGSGGGNWGAVINGLTNQLDKGFEVTLVAGEAIKAWDAVYLKNDGKMWKAKADAVSTLPAIGVVPADVAISAQGKVRLFGWIDYDDTSKTALTATRGDEIYVSNTVAGELTTTAPTLAQLIGIAKTTTTDHITRIMIVPSWLMNAATVMHSLSVGDATNRLSISSGGVVSLHGAAEGVLTLRAEMDYRSQVAISKPTQVDIGINKGYSLPIYAANDEQLFFRENVPGRWDGVSDITIHVKVCLMGAEDVGDKFQLRWSWEHSPAEEPVPVTYNDVDVETTILAGRADQYDEYEVVFTIDYDIDGVGNEIQPHELLSGRLRRIAASANEIDAEIAVLDWHTHYNVNKMFTAS